VNEPSPRRAAREDGVNALRLAQAAAAGAFAIDDGRGQPSSGQSARREFLQAARRADRAQNVVADELRDDGFWPVGFLVWNRESIFSGRESPGRGSIPSNRHRPA